MEIPKTGKISMEIFYKLLGKDGNGKIWKKCNWMDWKFQSLPWKFHDLEMVGIGITNFWKKW